MAWTEGLLVGAVVASTDAAAVFFLIHAGACGCARASAPRWRSSPAPTIRSPSSSPSCWSRSLFGRQPDLGRDRACCEKAPRRLIGFLGGRADRAGAQRLGCRRDCMRRSSPPARWWCSACARGARLGLPRRLSRRPRGRQPGDPRAQVGRAFLDAATWLAQIVMFVLLGLLAWPERLPQRLLPALAVALVLMLVARPAAVFLCLAPFRFSCARSCSCRGSACAARSASSSRRSRCWSGCPVRSSISTSASWSFWCRC